MDTMKKTVKRIIIFIMLLIIIFLFLIAPGRGKDTSRFTGWNYAHRGYFDNENGIPENSLLSFEKAVEKGFGIELDVQLSSDGVAMVFHDADLERVCGVKGKIWEYTADELQSMRLFGTEHTIPTLAQALELIDGRVPLLVEYKMDRVDTAVCAVGQALLDEYRGAYCVQSFDPRALIWYRQNAPQTVRGQLAQEFWKEEKYAGKPLYTALSFMVGNVATRPDFISYKFTDSSNIALKLCRLMGADAACWTLRSPQDYEQVQGNFNMYIFDSFDISACQ
ncbi:MAG: glycerophosphodiester phosphodiesterase [Oscillospiraceae bacterium]|nr:glycerophosphodiester phosphodiesterase [Oscillospiraceae bacterium]